MSILRERTIIAARNIPAAALYIAIVSGLRSSSPSDLPGAIARVVTHTTTA